MRVLLMTPPMVSMTAKIEGIAVGQPLGIAYLGAALERAGHEVRLLDGLMAGLQRGVSPDQLTERDTEHQVRASRGVVRRTPLNQEFPATASAIGLPLTEIEAEIRRFAPDVVGISIIFSSLFKIGLEVARLVKHIDPRIVTVVGGGHPTVAPESTLEHPEIDYVVRGEGELALPALLECIAAGREPRIPGVCYRRGANDKVITGWERILDLDQLPPPAFGLLEMEDYFASAAEGRSVKLYTSRGCTFDCSFCSVPFTSQRRFVAHSPERVCAEIDRLVEKYAISHVMFEDDNMGLNRRRFDRILSLIIERGHHLTLAARNLRADLLNDETLALMKRAGFEKVWVTPESGSQRVLDEVIGKKMDLGCVVDTIDRIQRQGMSVAAAFVMGLPGESLSEIHDTLQFARGLRERGVGEFWFSIATPIEGSRIFNNLRAAGRIDGMDLDRFSYCLGSYDGDDYTADHLAKLRQEIMLECNAPAGR
jgi:radical SAM superfamily enzyme YgiQ (UPF0313 family)